MPSALENMVKILKLERDQGGKDKAVVGGMRAYVDSWQAQARDQARRAAHHILIDEIIDVLREYEKIADEDERVVKLNYLLDRVTNRVAPPKAYTDRLPKWEEYLKSQPQPSPARPSRKQSQTRSDRRQTGPRRSSEREKFKAYDSANYDEDFTSVRESDELDLVALPRLSRPPRLPRPQIGLDEQLALNRELEAPTTEVKGIGKKFGELLELIELKTIRDLLYSFPRDYHDYTKQHCIKDLEPGQQATVIATIMRWQVVHSNSGGKDLIVVVSDGSGNMSVRFFKQHYLSAKLRRGMQVVLNGKVSYFRDMKQMTNPEWEELELKNLHSIGIVPVYRMTQGLRPRLYRRTMRTLIDEWAEKIPDPIPTTVLERNDLADLGWAIQQTHFPEGWDHLRHARRRLVFDNLLMLQLAMLGNRREWQSLPGPELVVDDSLLQAFTQAVFPFELTQAQKRAIEDIRGDMAKPVPMNRLVQGDVGSGKTAVAIVAIAIAQANGKQSAIMVPTGVLAEQHYRTISEAFAKAPMDEKPVIALLTGALTAAERESIYRGLADGSIDIVVGTQALIQQGVEFHDLAIAIIDEQQRFGVDQRAQLRGKGQNPDLLVMTATPIPRTLALTIHADLDYTVINELPAGRQQIVTKIIAPVARERLHGFVTAQLEEGRQAFFVHPLVEESETIASASAIEAYQRLSKVFFRQRVCLLHGRMSPVEKDTLMRDFAQHKYDVMVTTSVTELGVDVPNATVMVIDGANRFGLAQLHQFRGRVGRGQYQSYCFLIPDHSPDIDIDRIRAERAGSLNEGELSIAEQRLAAMEAASDGFELAELDWRLRGAGDLLGRRQSGLSKLQLLELMSPELVELAQREARTVYTEDPALDLPEHQLLADCVKQLQADSGDVS